MTERIWQRLPVTVEVSALSLLLSLAIAIPAALVSAYGHGTLFDRAATGLAFGAISLPGFFVGLLLVFFFVFHQGLVKALVALIGAGIALALLRTVWRPPDPASAAIRRTSCSSRPMRTACCPRSRS